MSKCLLRSLPEEANVIQKVALFTLFSQCSSCFFFISWYLCLVPFSLKTLSFLYTPPSFHILTFHFYLTNLSPWHLSFFTSEESDRKSLLSCDLHCSGHFLINVADKAVVHHLMRWQQATLNWKLPLFSLILSL